MKANFKYSEKDFFKPLKAKQIRRVLKDIVMDEGKNVVDMFDYVQKNFSSKNRSKIRRKTGQGTPVGGGNGGAVYTAVGINESRGQVLIWLEDGTDLRWRRMSKDWKSKTKGGLSFGPGKGRAMGFYHFPTYGIKARNFRDAIVDMRYPVFIREADRKLLDFMRANRWI